MTTRPPSSTNPSRNKENVSIHRSNHYGPAAALSPSPSPVAANQHGRHFRPSLVKSPEKQAEFWTDSFLGDNASQASLIPSPLPASNSALSKPRKKIRTTRTGHELPSRPRHRHTHPDLPASATGITEKALPKPLARGTSPIRSTGLSTPPRSREGSFVGSPIDVLSSPPPALTETYTRIDQEEDLAHTEGAMSDPESEHASKDRLAATTGYPPAKHASAESLRRLVRSRNATPTNQGRPASAVFIRDDNMTVASVRSDPTGFTGLSFVNQMSDPNLRNALTPHFQQSSADRDALRRAWASKKPIAFAKAGNVLLETDQVADSVSSSPQTQPNRLVAFGKANRVKLASDYLLRPQHQRTFSDTTDQVDRVDKPKDLLVHTDHWHNDDLGREAMPHNPRIQRQPYFSKTYGFPERRLSTQNAAGDIRGLPGLEAPLRKARSESPFAGVQTQSRDRRLSGALQTHEIVPDRGSAIQASTDSWTHPDEPVETVEHDPMDTHRMPQPDIDSVNTSPEKSRRLDFEFTGQSFQVSDSPPVRTKSTASDRYRDNEIRGLAQQAVTTTRLTQLRARESLEKLRQQTRSQQSEMAEGDVVPDAPAGLYRTTSHGSARSSNAPPARPTPDRQSSHDILQRLARGSSATPRSSTPSDTTANGNVVGSEREHVEKAQPAEHAQRFQVGGDIKETLSRPQKRDAIEATPKVVGAWTDTILPNTARTSKRNGPVSRYAQTPHVSAGGWVDTPAGDGQNGRLETVQEATQEIPEELMQGIANDNADKQTAPAERAMVAAPLPSLAQEVLGRVKDGRETRDSAQGATDTLANFGDATLQSLQDLLNMDETQLSTICLDLDQSDTEILGRLSSKLGRLQNNMEAARKGLTKLEHQISQPASAIEPAISSNGSESSQSRFSVALLTLTIPLPIFFRWPNHSRLPQLTALGWLFLTFWLWYLLECTLAELYSHPLYAERYTWPSEAEPEFPFVLPTVLYRWSKLDFFYPWIVQPLQRVLMGLIKMVQMWTGLSDGYLDGPGELTTDAIAEAVQGVPTGTGSYGLDLDDYL